MKLKIGQKVRILTGQPGRAGLVKSLNNRLGIVELERVTFCQRTDTYAYFVAELTDWRTYVEEERRRRRQAHGEHLRQGARLRGLRAQALMGGARTR